MRTTLLAACQAELPMIDRVIHKSDRKMFCQSEHFPLQHRVSIYSIGLGGLCSPPYLCYENKTRNVRRKDKMPHGFVLVKEIKIKYYF